MKLRFFPLRRAPVVAFVALLSFPFLLRAAEKSESFRAALESITGNELLDYSKTLADEKMAGREAGTPGGAEARKYLIEQYAKLKLQPAGPDGKFEQPFGQNFCNIVAVIPGRDPALKNEYVLVEAHYDHVGHGRHGMSYDPGEIHPGADDNASGSSALLEIAQAFSFLGEPPKRSILILATDGEEKGLLGAKHWAANPTIPIDKVVAGLNLDMIGRLRDDKLLVLGTRTGCGLRRLVGQQNEEFGMSLLFDYEFKPNSDCYPIFEKGVPMLLLHTGVHENYHRTSDTPEKLNAAGMSRVARFAFCIVNELADRPDRLAYRQNAKRENGRTETQLAEQSPKPPSRLGVSLDPIVKSDSTGVRIAKVEPDSPAAKAGLKEDDRIVEFAGREPKTCDELISLVMSAESSTKASVKSPKEENSREVQIELSGHPLRLGISWRTDDAEPKALILTHVVAGMPAALAGLQPGDRVYQVAGRDFADENEFLELANAPADSLDVLIERNGQMQLVHLNFKPAPPLKQAA
jgi:hypothetical protein